jgi:hypothetical protein
MVGWVFDVNKPNSMMLSRRMKTLKALGQPLEEKGLGIIILRLPAVTCIQYRKGKDG